MDNFNKTIAQGITLVDFWAEWCGPCRMLLPVIESVAQELEGKVKVAKVNVDNQEAIAQKYGILTIPTVILFKDGEVMEKLVGYKNKQVFIEMVNKYL
ncbi:MAG TPA: thioredoxin [Clostridiales bacterium]|nr:thioredoxin [Clostridiales bacterium]